MIHLSPIVTPGMMFTLAPIQTSLPILCVYSPQDLLYRVGSSSRMVWSGVAAVRQGPMRVRSPIVTSALISLTHRTSEVHTFGGVNNRRVRTYIAFFANTRMVPLTPSSTTQGQVTHRHGRPTHSTQIGPAISPSSPKALNNSLAAFTLLAKSVVALKARRQPSLSSRSFRDLGVGEEVVRSPGIVDEPVELVGSQVGGHAAVRGT